MNNSVTKRPTTLLESLFGDDLLNNPGYGTGIDIYREDGNYRVDVEMPGFDKEDIDIQFSGDVLSIKAEHQETNEADEKEYYYRSRNKKVVSRQIRFADVDASAIDASYEQGILQIVLPSKVEEETTNKINIK